MRTFFGYFLCRFKETLYLCRQKSQSRGLKKKFIAKEAQDSDNMPKEG